MTTSDISPPASSTLDEVNRWYKGIQAIFAGFIASTSQHGVQPNIPSFMDTEQAKMIQSTLFSICSTQRTPTVVSPPNVNHLQETLYAVLLDKTNIYTKLRTNTGTDSEGMTHAEWELTDRGRKRFFLVDNPPARNARGGDCSPLWWNA